MPGKKSNIRLVILGGNYTGKTSLCVQYVSHSFSNIYNPTDSLNTYRMLTVVNNSAVMVQIDDVFAINHPSLLDPRFEDSENREVFENIVENKRYRKDKSEGGIVYSDKAIDGLVFVFDLSQKESFELIEKMISYIHNKENERGYTKHPKTTKKILVGTKADLFTNSIKKNEIFRVKQAFGLEYYKTSAFDYKSIEKMFNSLINAVVEKKFKVDISLSSTVDSEFGTEGGLQKGILDWCDCSKRRKNMECNIC